MATADLTAIAKTFAQLAGNIDGVKSALHYEPEQLPDLPAVTMLLGPSTQNENATGPQTENTWTWTVTLYLPLGGRVVGSDFQRGQELLMELLPQLYAIARRHPDLDDTCLKATLADAGDDPAFDADQKALIKELELTVRTEEV